jgi:hypothetical protein
VREELLGQARHKHGHKGEPARSLDRTNEHAAVTVSGWWDANFEEEIGKD